MSSQSDAWALQKRVLQARARLYRLEIRAELQSVGATLRPLNPQRSAGARSPLRSWVLDWLLRQVAGPATARTLGLLSSVFSFVQVLRLGTRVLNAGHGTGARDADPPPVVAERMP